MIEILNEIPKNKLRLLVFDLDGTLVDSTQDLCNSVNATLREYDRAECDLAQITSYVGDGAQMLVRRAFFGVGGSEKDLPGGEELFAGAMQFFLTYYRAHKLDFTRTYEGVMEALPQLVNGADGEARKIAVLTNKPVGPSKAICDALGIGEYTFQNYGGDSFQVKKPDPLPLRTLMEEAGVSPEETVMIGDSGVDVQTARNAGVWMVGCRYGLSPAALVAGKPDVIVDSASEWVEALSI